MAMTNAEKVKILKQYRNSIRNIKLNPKDRDDVLRYNELANTLQRVGCIDYDYADHINYSKNWDFAKEVSRVKNFTFQQCCAFLTLIWRQERLDGDWFVKYINDGSVSKLLDRLIEVFS